METLELTQKFPTDDGAFFLKNFEIFLGQRFKNSKLQKDNGINKTYLVSDEDWFGAMKITTTLETISKSAEFVRISAEPVMTTGAKVWIWCLFLFTLIALPLFLFTGITAIIGRAIYRTTEKTLSKKVKALFDESRARFD